MELPKFALSGLHHATSQPKPALTTNKYIFSSYADNNDNDDSDDDIEGVYDSCCALCDDGGDVLLCEGPCMRCFHPTVDSGIGSRCESLGFENAAEYNALATFLCNNCQFQKHQCFVCGNLGSSNETSSTSLQLQPNQVYPCVSATCGYYYHPICVANKLYPNDEIMAKQFSNQIASGEPLICPIHKCHRCQGVEDPNVYALQFAVCRRCPKSYHRQCMPRAYDGSANQRAWDNLLPHRILMYCMRHKVEPTLQTPKRDHLLFPFVERKRISEREKSATPTLLIRRSNPFGNVDQHIHQNDTSTPGTMEHIYGQSRNPSDT